MTSASPVAALLAASLETVGVVLYLGATALLLRLAVRWAREAIEPPPSPPVSAAAAPDDRAARPAGPAPTAPRS